MTHVYWKNIAEDLISRGWGTESESANALIKTSSDERLMLCLLIDIAQSLRPLRCRNFIEIPGRLSTLAVEIRGLRRDLKTRRKKKK